MEQIPRINIIMNSKKGVAKATPFFYWLTFLCVNRIIVTLIQKQCGNMIIHGGYYGSAG